jgi:formylglycine-generating enzyme required for sulfatase activity
MKPIKKISTILWILTILTIDLSINTNEIFCVTNKHFKILSERIRINTVRVTSKFSSMNDTQNGFGFIVGEKSGYLYIVTAKHVVIQDDEYSRGQIEATPINVNLFYDRKNEHEAHLIDQQKDKSAADFDIAIIKILKPSDFNFSDNFYDTDIKQNDQVWFLGRDKEWFISFKYKPGGVINTSIADGCHIITAYLDTIRVGTSGAPLFSENGISGLIISSDNNITKAIQVRTLKQFVQSYNCPWGKVSVKTKEKQFTNKYGMSFVLISAGIFNMGSPKYEKGHEKDETQHVVFITQDYYMQTTEVTQWHWERVMGKNPSRFKKCGHNCPVECVSWHDVQRFINKLNMLDKKYTYKLPTEAEWEYAARAGTQTPFAFGNCLNTNEANYKGYYPTEGCPSGNFYNMTLEVGRFPKNDWGLYDMHGNVWEWCLDWYDKYSNDAVEDPVGPVLAEYRLIRGGSWSSNASSCRSAFRGGVKPEHHFYNIGFRLRAICK